MPVFVINAGIVCLIIRIIGYNIQEAGTALVSGN